MGSFWIFSNPFAPRLCTEQRRGEPVGGVAIFSVTSLVIFFQEEVRKDRMEIDGSMLAKRAGQFL